jgi:hypothetical protein
MKRLIIVSSILLISSYVFTAEPYPRQGKLSRKPAFRKENHKSPSITLHNKSNYDITTRDLIINPGESKKVQLQENLELAVFVSVWDEPLMLDFKKSLPQDVYLTKKSNLIELTYDEDCIKSYICT